ncbi:prefoldin subunit 6 [Hysterangium stoloniferum]|nr:prefoldin subunit 6 [Hysterangium stoloniferum]
MSTISSLDARLQVATSEYQKIETELSNAVEVRQQLDAQLSENEQVKKEFSQLDPSNTIYKLIGPVLVQQDQADAKSNVETRLEYIRSEIKRVEAVLKDLGTKSEKKKSEIVALQTAYQKQQQNDSGSATPAPVSA